jgi:hypothetical protein
MYGPQVVDRPNVLDILARMLLKKKDPWISDVKGGGICRNNNTEKELKMQTEEKVADFKKAFLDLVEGEPLDAKLPGSYLTLFELCLTIAPEESKRWIELKGRQAIFGNWIKTQTRLVGMDLSDLVPSVEDEKKRASIVNSVLAGRCVSNPEYRTEVLESLKLDPMLLWVWTEGEGISKRGRKHKEGGAVKAPKVPKVPKIKADKPAPTPVYNADGTEVVKRKRGRPRKNPLPAPVVIATVATETVAAPVVDVTPVVNVTEAVPVVSTPSV